MGIFLFHIKTLSTGKNEAEPSCILCAFLDITFQKSSTRPQKPTGKGHKDDERNTMAFMLGKAE